MPRRVSSRYHHALPPQRPKTKGGQERVYQYLVDYKEDNNGLSPSLREIADRFGYRSHSTVTIILDALELRGFLRRDEQGRIIIPDIRVEYVGQPLKHKPPP